MPAEKSRLTEELILKVLKQYSEGGLRYNNIFKKVSQGKDYFHRVGSKGTFNNAMKSLKEDGRIQHNERTKNYILTEAGKQVIGKLEIVDQILLSQTMDMYAVDWSYWKSKPDIIASATYFIDHDKDFSSEVIMVPIERIRELQNDWMPQIKKCINEYGETLGLNNESSIEEVWKALFRGVKRIVVVEILTPSLLIEKLSLARAGELSIDDPGS
jgi:predicted transcriptional regulator